MIAKSDRPPNLLGNRATVLAAEAQTLFRQYWRASVARADAFLALGAAMNAHKAELPRGQWAGYLQSATVAERTAQRAMRFAKAGLESATVADFGIRETDRLIANLKRKGAPVSEDGVRAEAEREADAERQARDERLAIRLEGTDGDPVDVLTDKLAKADALHETMQAQIRESEAESARIDRMTSAIRDALLAAPRSNALALEVVDEVLARFFGVARKG